MKKYDVVTFGEVLRRYSPYNNFERLNNSCHYRVELGGAEANVAAALSNIAKFHVALITRIPGHDIGDWVERQLLSNSISTEMVVRDKTPCARLGTYYYEAGSQPRSSQVIYDRSNSSFVNSNILNYDIDFSCAKIFHTTGITLALSNNVRSTAIQLMKEFRKNGTLISFDVNYRASIWEESTARENIEKILPYVDILFVSEETLRRMFQCKGSIENTLVKWATKYDIRFIATPQRTVISSSNHKFTSLVYDKENNKFLTEKPYNISVVDRIGSGDAYIAGFLMGLLTSKYEYRVAMEYGNALAALKCTIPGDIVTGSMREINTIIKNHKEDSKYENLTR